MKLLDQTRLNTGLKPHYDEPFWELIIIEKESPEDYAFSRIFHFNSLKDTTYQNLRAVMGDVLYMWIPESLIYNANSKVLRDNMEFVIKNKVRCIKCADGYFWVVNDDAILESLKNSNV